MSRKLERNVRKNASKISAYRKQQGLTAATATEKLQVFKGRSIMLTVFLIGISLFLMLGFARTDQEMQWFTTISYFLFGVFIFFVRRPYLKVSKSSISKRGFAREYSIDAEDIKQITIKSSQVLIELKNNKRWLFSKALNFFDVAAMGAYLIKFSEFNHIQVIDETAKK